jgi:hypothetical protein
VKKTPASVVCVSRAMCPFGCGSRVPRAELREHIQFRHFPKLCTVCGKLMETHAGDGHSPLFRAPCAGGEFTDNYGHVVRSAAGASELTRDLCDWLANGRAVTVTGRAARIARVDIMHLAANVKLTITAGIVNDGSRKPR